MHRFLRVLTCPTCLLVGWRGLGIEERVGLVLIACLSVGAAAVVLLACWGWV